MGHLWREHCLCERCKAVHVRHAEQDAALEAEQREHDMALEREGRPWHPSMGRCESCRQLTANNWGLCTDCTKEVDDYAGIEQRDWTPS